MVTIQHIITKRPIVCIVFLSNKKIFNNTCFFVVNNYTERDSKIGFLRRRQRFAFESALLPTAKVRWTFSCGPQPCRIPDFETRLV